MLIEQRRIEALPESLKSYPALLQRIFAARGISDAEQLDKRLQALLPFHLLKDIDKACLRLEQALVQEERIMIVGDYDADGATSTALAISALKSMNAKTLHFLVPNRFEFGYGLTAPLVEVAKEWQPDLIITVDNGVSNIDGVEAANQAGIDVLITDHHIAPKRLPPACAIVNPNQEGDAFPSKSIAGVGVIFYVMLALRRHLIEKAWFEKQGMEPPNMAQFLDLVALGTVADVVGLDQNNRIMVNQGLARIRQGLTRPGIFALIQAAHRNPLHLTETDLSFAVAPRLNAAGRLKDMSIGISCLLSDELDKAEALANTLNQLNQERQVIEAGMKEQAFNAIETIMKKTEGLTHLPLGLCLADPSWHQGVIGILAGRLKEYYHRPVIAFALVDATELKGSARSIPCINIRDVLAAIDKDNPGLIKKFGGHAMAAGLSIAPENFATFQKCFIEAVEAEIHPSQCRGIIFTDGALESEELSLETAHLLREAGPWGQHFPEPCFDNVFHLVDQRLVGQKHLKLQVACLKTKKVFEAIAFNIDLNLWPNYRAKKIHLAYKLDINIFQDKIRLQLMVEALKNLDEEKLESAEMS